MTKCIVSAIITNHDNNNNKSYQMKTFDLTVKHSAVVFYNLHLLQWRPPVVQSHQ